MKQSLQIMHLVLVLASNDRIPAVQTTRLFLISFNFRCVENCLTSPISCEGTELVQNENFRIKHVLESQVVSSFVCCFSFSFGKY